MKTKLLRKVRKRYSITYEEDSTFYKDVAYGTYDIMFLRDNESCYRYRATFVGKAPSKNHKCFETKEEAFKYCHSLLCKWMLSDYSNYGVRRNAVRKLKKEKLWYNP